MLTLAGEGGATARAAAVFAFEKDLATAHWTRVESRDADKTLQPLDRRRFRGQGPGYPWTAWMAEIHAPAQPFYLVAQPSALTGEAAVFARTPLPVLQDWLRLRTLRAYSPYLAKAYDDATFAFYGTVLAGVPQQEPRWKRSVTVVSRNMGEAIGRQYVARYFPPEAKAAADDLVKNVIAAMGARIDRLEWMAPKPR